MFILSPDEAVMAHSSACKLEKVFCFVSSPYASDHTITLR